MGVKEIKCLSHPEIPDYSFKLFNSYGVLMKEMKMSGKFALDTGSWNWFCLSYPLD